MSNNNKLTVFSQLLNVFFALDIFLFIYYFTYTNYITTKNYIDLATYLHQITSRKNCIATLHYITPLTYTCSSAIIPFMFSSMNSNTPE